jgi:hypothetical protein
LAGATGNGRSLLDLAALLVRLIWIALILFNLGIWLVAAAAFIGPGWLTVTGRAAEALGVASFTVGVWRRVKPSGA